MTFEESRAVSLILFSACSALIRNGVTFGIPVSKNQDIHKDYRLYISYSNSVTEFTLPDPPLCLLEIIVMYVLASIYG